MKPRHPLLPLLTGALCLLVCCAGSSAKRRPKPPLSRAAFVRALARLKLTPAFGYGTPRGATKEARVLRWLGPPDDIITREDRDYVYMKPGEHILGYGTEGHLTLPTLGSVSISPEGYVTDVSGNWGSPPPVELIGETELRELLRLIDRAPALDSWAAPSKWDPAVFLQVVNQLRTLGKAKALAALGEYARINGRRVYHVSYSGARDDEVFAILAALFEAPYDPLRHGPRHSLLLWDDVPLLAPFPADYRGMGKHAYYPWDIEIYEREGRLRRQPLRPPDNPLEIPDRIAEWAVLRGINLPPNGETIRRIRNQVLRLVASAYPPDQAPSLRFGIGDDVERNRLWREAQKSFARLNARWDPERNQYVAGSKGTAQSEASPR